MTQPNTPALRAWLTRKLTAVGSPTMTGVQITDHFPGDRNISPEMIWAGGFRPAAGGTDVRTMRGGTKDYTHETQMEVVIQVRSRVTPTDAETRCIALYQALAGVVAANVVPFDVDEVTPLAYHAVMSDWNLDTGWTDTGAASELKTSIRFHIDT